MKMFKFMTIFFCASLILGCSNEENTELNDVNKAEFFNELKTFNSNYQVNVIDKQVKNLASKDDCGFWCWTGKVIVVAGADLVGAGAGAGAVGKIAGTLTAASGGTGAPVATGLVVAGAVVGGAAASITAGVKISESTSKKQSSDFGKKMLIRNLDIAYPEKYSYLSNVGALHNIEVNNYFNKKSSKSNENNEILDSEEFMNANNEIQLSVDKYIKEGSDIKNFTQDLLDKNLIDENMKTVYDIFFNIYNNSENEKNIGDIVNYYIDAIANTNVLTEKEKECLIISLSVASESPFYWLNQN